MPILKPSPVGRGPRDSGEKNLPGKRLIGLEPTTFHTVVECFNR